MREHDSLYSWTRLFIALLLATVGNIGMWVVVIVLPDIQQEFKIDRGTAVPRSILNSCCMSGSTITTTHIPILPTVASKSAMNKRVQEYKLSCSLIKKFN